MDVYRTEEEQLEAIKRWWKENGKGILMGVGLAVVLVFGWQSWQQNTQTKGEAASVLYAQLQESAQALWSSVDVPAGDDKAASENPQRLTLHRLGKQLKDEYAGTTYSILAAMMLARDEIETADTSGAEEELRWALAQNPGDAIAVIVNLRLARVLAMKGEHDNALALLAGVESGAQKPSYEELRGDIYLAKGDLDKARAAYQAGLAAAPENASVRSLLKTKLDDLAVTE